MRIRNADTHYLHQTTPFQRILLRQAYRRQRTFYTHDRWRSKLYCRSLIAVFNAEEIR